MAVREYLADVAGMVPANECFRYRCIEHFVLENGRMMKSAPLHPGTPRGVMKMCYSNSLDRSINDGLPYVEGYAYRPGLIPLPHAWNLNPDGTVSDCTWDDPEECEYFGVGISLEYALFMAVRTGTYGVLDNWSERWPLLSGDHGPDMWRDGSIPADLRNRV